MQVAKSLPRDTLGGMCQRVTCKTCGKPTFAGCGMHVDQVLGDVPRGDRCQGHERDAGTGGFLSKLLGR